MNGSTTTNGWDVVCTYSVDALNGFLQVAYDAGLLAKSVSVSVDTTDPVFGFPFTVKYDINFESPLISFSAKADTAILSMPIGAQSSYTVTIKNSSDPPQTTDIPTGYSVVAQVPLGVVDGTTGEVVNQSGVLTFSDGNSSEYSIILQFENTKGSSFTIEPAPDGTSPLQTYFLPAIADYFQNNVNQIDYALAGVNNQQPDDGSEVLTPNSFAFSSYVDPTDADDDGVLSLFIQTAQSGKPPGSATPHFQPSGQATTPVPQGYTASLIFSESLIVNALLGPSLEQSGFTCSFTTPSSGIQSSLAVDQSVIADSDNGTYISGAYTYSGLNISLKSDPVLLTIYNGQIGANWSGDTVSSWSQTVAGVPGHTSYTYGNVNISIEVEKGPYPITVDDNAFSIPDIVFNESDFQISTKAQSCSWYEFQCSTLVPTYYESMPLQIPIINISFPSFNFFLETNLLSPGNQMISVDAKAGVSTPCDFLIVGQTVTKPS